MIEAMCLSLLRGYLNSFFVNLSPPFVVYGYIIVYSGYFVNTFLLPLVTFFFDFLMDMLYTYD